MQSVTSRISNQPRDSITSTSTLADDDICDFKRRHSEFGQILQNKIQECAERERSSSLRRTKFSFDRQSSIGSLRLSLYKDAQSSMI